MLNQSEQARIAEAIKRAKVSIIMPDTVDEAIDAAVKFLSVPF